MITMVIRKMTTDRLTTWITGWLIDYNYIMLTIRDNTIEVKKTIILRKRMIEFSFFIIKKNS